MAESRGPAKTISVMGENWELVKSATDGSISFPFNRVDITNFSCEKLNDFYYVLMFNGFLKPTPNTLETPQRLVFIGFPNYPVNWANTGPEQLRKMHIYKADMKNFANEFVSGFLGQTNNDSSAGDIKPFPDLSNKGESDGRTEQTDEE